MIKTLSFDKSLISKAGMDFSWLSGNPFFNGSPQIEFKTGLNIVVGPNGSGKSSLVDMIAMYMAAKQGGRSCVTQTWLSEMFPYTPREDITADPILPCKIAHDGQPILYHSSKYVVGLDDGHFDDDFFSEGIAEIRNKGSEGETGLNRLGTILSVLKDGRSEDKDPTSSKFPKGIDHRVKGVNSYWEERLNRALALHVPTIPQGPKTIVLDEPDASFSLEWQARVWRNIFAKIDPNEFQIIVASHSPFALGIKDAHYIETQPGFANKSLETVRALFSN